MRIVSITDIQGSIIFISIANAGQKTILKISKMNK
jgi:hypothetical protein